MDLHCVRIANEKKNLAGMHCMHYKQCMLNAVNGKPKRAMVSFQATPEVARMLDRARKGGVKLAWLCNTALRVHLAEKGFARKKDLAA